jgi:hypothetical protein
VVNYTVLIPPNSTAELIFDDSVKEVQMKGQNAVLDLSSPIQLESGKYEFVVR